MIITLLRTTVLFIFVTVALRLMGKRQIGDMQPGELVVTLLISEIAAIPLQDTSQPVLNGVVAIFMLVILEVLLSVMAMKFISIRKLICGSSVVVIENGRLNQKAMQNVRMTVIDLIELLREQGFFNLNDIAFAVLEVNGTLSVIEKTEKRPLKVCDMKKEPLEKASLALPVISDGKFIKESLRALNVDKKTVLKNIKRKPNEIFLMTLDQNGNMYISFKEK